jgi:hypothetical protein
VTLLAAIVGHGRTIALAEEIEAMAETVMGQAGPLGVWADLVGTIEHGGRGTVQAIDATVASITRDLEDWDWHAKQGNAAAAQAGAPEGVESAPAQ